MGQRLTRARLWLWPFLRAYGPRLSRNVAVQYAIVSFITILILNWRCFDSYFVGDDFWLISQLYHGSILDFLKARFGLIRLLSDASIKLDYLLYGTNPLGYHVSNALFQFANSVLVFLIIRLISRGHLALSFVVGFLFTVNPVLFQSIAWITQRGQVMATCFFLLSFYVFLRFRAGGSRKHYWASVLFFFFGLLSREDVVALPIMLVVYDLLQDFKLTVSDLRVQSNILGLIRRNIRVWLPYFGLLAAYFALRFMSFRSVAGSTWHVNYAMGTMRVLEKTVIFLGYTFFGLPPTMARMYGSIPNSEFYTLALLFLAGFIPLFVLVCRNPTTDWRVFNFGLAWTLVSYLLHLFYHPATPWSFSLPAMGVLCMAAALIFSLPWNKAAWVMSILLIGLYAGRQFQFNAHFGVAGSYTKQIKETINGELGYLRAGDKLVLIDIPDMYGTAWVYPLTMVLERALEKPFSDMNIPSAYNIQRVVTYQDPNYPEPRSSLIEVTRDAAAGLPRTSHLFRWNKHVGRLHEISFFYRLDKAIIETSGNGNVQVVPIYIKGDTRLALIELPTSKVTYYVRIPIKASLSFAITLNPETWRPDWGDGVLFEILVKDQVKEAKLFSRYIDPKNDAKDRQWHEATVDLSPYVGKVISLTLMTSPGPRGDDRYDWAAWGNLELVPLY